MNEKNKDNKSFSSLKGIHKVVPIILGAVAIFIGVCLISSGMGPVGAGIRTALKGLFSNGAFVIPIAMIIQAICYAEDLENNKIKSRTILSLITLVLASCIDYSIFCWNGEAIFSPVKSFTEMNNGGFIGGVFGFLLTKLLGNLGVIILSVLIVAVYAVFFYGEKAGTIGRAAIRLSDKIKQIVASIKNKQAANAEKKRQLKEDAEQHQREMTSAELIDDEFFQAKGNSSSVKIKQLGIEENADTHGLSPLLDPERRIPVTEPVVVNPDPERKRKKGEKPVNLSYGVGESNAEKTFESASAKPRIDKAFLGIDESADDVFTKDFDLFDFATSEKKAAKFARRVSVKSAITEEIDEMTLAEMRANHEPTEEELRRMKFEEKKRDLLKKMEGRRPNRPTPQPASTPTTTQSPQHNEAVSQPSATTSISTPTATEQPISVVPVSAPVTAEPTTQAQPIAQAAPRTPTSNIYSSSRVQKAPPVKTVEFTVSKSPAPVVETKPVIQSVGEKPKNEENEAENVAILISERLARSTPGYARSANDLKTYTTVVSSGDDELYRQLQGISTPEEHPETVADECPILESVKVNEVDYTEPNVNSNEDAITQENINEVVDEISYAPARESADEIIIKPTTETVAQPTPVLEYEADPTFEPKTEPCAQPYYESPRSVEFSVGEERNPITEPTAQSTYQRAAGYASAMVNEPVEAPEFKPYTPPVTPIQTTSFNGVIIEENVLKVERSMLPPTPEAVFTSTTTVEQTPAPNVGEVSVHQTTNATAEPVFTPADDEVRFNEEVAEESKPEPTTVDVAEPLFDVVDGEDESSDTIIDEEGDPGVEISFDEENEDDFVEDEDDSLDEDDLDDEDETEDDDEEDSEEDSEEEPEEEPEDDSDLEEIPPEKQNPDVIKMREMFPCLNPIGESRPVSKPASETKAEVTIPAESDEVDVPFDNPVEVKPAPAATSLISVADIEEIKEEKKKPDYSDYKFPPIDLLAKQEDIFDDNIAAETQEKADRLIETLADFGVTASTKGVDRGPRITRYEVVPAKGVKVSSILNLENDIALNLAAGSIRMEAPIPGKSAVGIEIPNEKSTIVRLRDLLETPDFETAKSKTFVCIGRDVAGQPVFGDLAKMPHLLIAGATGMGKSVCINSLLVSILYKAKPDEVKLIMIDPKQVEFTMYNGIPHLLVPVVSDPKQAAGSIMWAVEEMERRYNLLKGLCVRNVDAYNEKVAHDPSLGDPIPSIIIVIDEFADLMLQVKDPVENLVIRIAQKARAAGIHLIIGTQRPSVNVITGVIKANIPSRISCKVMSNVDSKTILDCAGAEKLLDKGDSLYAPAGAPKAHRLQCAFVSDGEVESIMDYLRAQGSGDTYDSSIMEDIESAAKKLSKKGGDRDDDGGSEGGGEGHLNDRQFLDAVEIAVNSRKISTSLIQRKMSIGYSKAAKFIDIMEDMGIVGPPNRQRAREVIMSPEEWREKQARSTYD